MNYELVVIGDEILLGQVTDTNSGTIARALEPEGFQLRGISTVGDNADQIRHAITEALARVPLVITTGGLGPTKDDITRSVMLDLFGGSLVRNSAVLDNIRRIFDQRGLEMNDLTADQAMVPSTCRVIRNDYGTAPVMWFERDGRVLITLPGVPTETAALITGDVGEAIRLHFAPGRYWAHYTVNLTGISESALAEQLREFEKSLYSDTKLAYLPSPGYITLRLDVWNYDQEGAWMALDRLTPRLLAAVKPYLAWVGEKPLAEELLELLRLEGLTLATAESCTGGNIAHSITEVAGCSDVYMGSVVSYSNDVKRRLLGVSDTDLATWGAVSQPVVRAMAEGACRRLGTDCAVATSGIAGPGGGTYDKPVGTIWIAATVRGRTVTRLLHLSGRRRSIIARATTEALLLLHSLLPPAAQ